MNREAFCKFLFLGSVFCRENRIFVLKIIRQK